MQSRATCRFQYFNDAHTGALLHHDDFAFGNDESIQGNLKRVAGGFVDFEDLSRGKAEELPDGQPQPTDLNANAQWDVMDTRQLV
jgi:hypothetical protein